MWPFNVDSELIFNKLQYRGLAPMYYRGAAAVIVAYDITDEVGNHGD